MSLGNMYAGMKFVGRPDSWYEPDDDSAYEAACEFAWGWLEDNTDLPEAWYSQELIDEIANEYLADDEGPGMGRAEEINEWYADYIKACEDKNDWKQIEREERGE